MTPAGFPGLPPELWHACFITRIFSYLFELYLNPVRQMLSHEYAKKNGAITRRRFL
jgi:hypothetical protein